MNKKGKETPGFKPGTQTHKENYFDSKQNLRERKRQAKPQSIFLDSRDPKKILSPNLNYRSPPLRLTPKNHPSNLNQKTIKSILFVFNYLKFEKTSKEPIELDRYKEHLELEVDDLENLYFDFSVFGAGSSVDCLLADQFKQKSVGEFLERGEV